jgi:hypothetical protein
MPETTTLLSDGDRYCVSQRDSEHDVGCSHQHEEHSKHYEYDNVAITVAVGDVVDVVGDVVVDVVDDGATRGGRRE